MTSPSNDELTENVIKLIESQTLIGDRYFDIRRIDPTAGDGCFSLVFKAQDNLSKKKRDVVLKFFNPLEGRDRYRTDCFHRESSVLKELSGQRNILPLIQEKTDITLILDHNGIPFPLPLMFYVSHLADFNVREYIYSDKANFLTSIIYFREMCKAVQRIHSKQLCHRDIKPGNFLIYKKRYVCLSDFGTARFFGERSNPIRDHYSFPIGDTRYTAPELQCGLYFSPSHNFCADIYSLGTILFELFTRTILGQIIFPDTQTIIDHFYKVPEHDRLKVFDEVIGSIAKDRTLPSVRDFNKLIPKQLSYEVDRLYQGMACLDYRNRETNFQTIFLRLNICAKIIQIQKQEEDRKLRKIQKKKGLIC